MKLLDICDISGKTVKRFLGNKKYVATGDIIDNTISSYSMVTYDNKPSRANIEFDENELLFAKMINTRKVILSNSDNINNIYSTGFYCLKPKDNIDINYLYYFINSEAFNKQKDKNCSGATQKAINNEGLEKIIINDVPSINEQIKLAKKLKIIDGLILIKKEQIKDLDELIKSQFVEMFGDFNNSKYKKIKLDKIANIGSSHRVFTNEFVDDGIPFYRGTEITMLANGVKPKECFYISKEHYEKICSDKTKPKINDLLMPSICNKGQIWLVNTDEPFYYKDGRVLSISLKTSNINPKYLHYYMKNKTIEEYPKLGSGSTFAEFKIFLLKDVDVIMPPIEIQNKFANIVEQIDKQKFEFENSLKKLEELQAALMQEYFG